MIPLPREGLCLQCRRHVPIAHGDATQKAFKCDKCRILELEAELAATEKAWDVQRGELEALREALRDIADDKPPLSEWAMINTAKQALKESGDE